MGDVFGWLLHQGIVRVLSVPITMTAILLILYATTAPPPWHDDDDEGTPRAS
jgi:hypothetical protein